LQIQRRTVAIVDVEIELRFVRRRIGTRSELAATCPARRAEAWRAPSCIGAASAPERRDSYTVRAAQDVLAADGEIERTMADVRPAA
jgi:hypothetical protein